MFFQQALAGSIKIFGVIGAELQKVGILVSRISDIFGGKSENFLTFTYNFHNIVNI